MAIGDLITGVSSTRGNQYEWAGMLFGTGTNWIVTEMDGLDSQPDMVTDDSQRNDDHGGLVGIDLLSPRNITMAVDYLGSSHADVMAAYRQIAKVMRPLSALYPFAFQRPNEVKKQVFVRPRQRSLPSTADVAMGLAEGTLAWLAPDPRIYSLAQNHAQIVLGAGVATAAVVIANAGDFHAWPKFIISGTGTNPKVKVTAQTADPLDGTNWNTQQIDTTAVMGAADVLSIDANIKDIQLNGVNAYTLKADDNQWWQYMPGNNTITFSRSTTAGVMTLDIYWYDCWL